MKRRMKSQYLIMITIVIVLIIMSYIFHDMKQYNRVPRKIWTYWDDPLKIPKTVKMCMKGWAKWNPDYEITLLTKKNYHSYVTIPDEIREHPNFQDSPQRFSDLIRLWTLAEHGGVWIDASILLNAPLDDWLFPRYAEFSGFYMERHTTKKQYPVLESFFFGSNKGSPFVRKWRDEFSELARYPSVDSYVDSRIKMGIDIQNLVNLNYFAIYLSAQKVLQLDQYPIDLMIFHKAEDKPYRYLIDANWDSKKAVRLACSDPSYVNPIMKLTSTERKMIETEINDELSEEKCGWIQ